MNCSICQHEFDALLDGELDAATATALRQHLGDCSECSAAWQDYQAAWAAFTTAPEIEPSTNFVARVMNAVDVAEREPAPAFGWLTTWFYRMPRLATVAATVLVLVSASFAYRSYRTETSCRLLADMPLVQQLDLLKDMDVIRKLDDLVPPVFDDDLDNNVDEVWNT